MSRKAYVLDTNVLLHDPGCLQAFEENDVVITEPVLEELDKLKRGPEELNRNAREAAKWLDKILTGMNGVPRRRRPRGNGGRSVDMEFAPVAIPGTPGGRLHILMDSRRQPVRTAAKDDWVLRLVLTYFKSRRQPVIIVSKDIIMRVKAMALGFECQDYRRDRARAEVVRLPLLPVEYLGNNFFAAPPGEVVPVPGILQRTRPNGEGNAQTVIPGYYLLEELEESRHVVHINEREEVRLVVKRPSLCKFHRRPGIRPRNLEQVAAVDALMNPEIKLVCLIGRAGTGKTMLALATALDIYFHHHPDGLEGLEEFRNDIPFAKERRKEADEGAIPGRFPVCIYISRPMIPVGDPMGFLPGDVEEKTMPWMEPILDNLHCILGKNETENLFRNGVIKPIPLALIRGRTFTDSILIIDEAQNLTPQQAKTIITRAGENCKIIFTGDPHQIDSPYIDRLTNGLIYTADRMGLEDCVAVIPVAHGERSRLSERAAELL